MSERERPWQRTPEQEAAAKAWATPDDDDASRAERILTEVWKGLNKSQSTAIQTAHDSELWDKVAANRERALAQGLALEYSEYDRS